MRFAFIDVEKAFYPVLVLCRVMEVGRSGYDAWLRRGPSARTQADKVLESTLAVAFRDSRGTYGSPRIRAQLTAQGIPVSKRRVARLMRRRGLCGLRKAGARSAARCRPAGELTDGGPYFAGGW